MYTGFRLRDYKTIFMLNSTEHEISSTQKINAEKLRFWLALKDSDIVFILLVMVVILTFIRRINFILC